ncbi:MAG TPA: methionine synthase, partial [Rhizobium sp.]|nr:methionine synthase [Rhizobium sp.]
AAMRQALDNYTPGPRPTIETIVEHIGPLRNKTAEESSGDAGRERRGRRRG